MPTRTEAFRSLAFRVALLLALLPAPAAVAQAPPDTAAVERQVDEELKTTRTPGAAVALIRGGKVIFARGFGVASVETKAPVTPEMLFRLGSTTKMLTAAMVVSLAEDGKLALDRPIGSYVPGLSPRASNVTLHQLLSHASGLRDEATMFGLHDDPALGQTVRAITDQFFFAEPGRVFSYSNPGYWVAGFVAEIVAGKPYADVMAERLFEPLGMSRTTLRPVMAMTYPLAQGHQQVGTGAPQVVRPAADNVGNWPAGSVFSNLEDLSRFVIAFMNTGTIEGRQALPAAVIRRLATGYLPTPGPGPASYGYGLTIETDRGVRLVHHGGSRAGYGSVIRMAPDRQAAVIILANGTGASLPRTTAAAMDLVLERGPAPAASPLSELPIGGPEAAALVGRYSQTDKPDVEVLLQEGMLFLRAGTLQPQPIVRVGDRRYAVRPASGSRLQPLGVVFGADGRAEFLYRGSRALKRLPE